MIECDDQTFEDMRPLLGFRKLVTSAAHDDFLLMLDVVMQRFL